MLKSEVESSRTRHAQYLKSLREMYGIRFTTVQRETGMSTNVLYRLERGEEEWKIDSEIAYLLALNKIIDKKLQSHPGLSLPARPPLLAFYHIKHHS